VKVWLSAHTHVYQSLHHSPQRATTPPLTVYAFRLARNSASLSPSSLLSLQKYRPPVCSTNPGTNINKMAADTHSCGFSCMPPSILKVLHTPESSFQRFSPLHNLRLQETNNRTKKGDHSHKAQKNRVQKKPLTASAEIFCAESVHHNLKHRPSFISKNKI